MTDVFIVDPRIAADSVVVAEWRLCQVRLMDDARFPWLLLLPRRPGVDELTDLDAADLALAISEIKRAADALRMVAPADKLNVAALGNIVRQLHVHVVGRTVGDAAWPGPVWGHGARVPRSAADTAAMLDRLRSAFGGGG